MFDKYHSKKVTFEEDSDVESQEDKNKSLKYPLSFHKYYNLEDTENLIKI